MIRAQLLIATTTVARAAAASLLLSGCSLIPDRLGPVPDEDPIHVSPRPTAVVADVAWSWEYPVIDDQPIWGTVIAASEDGQRVLLAFRPSGTSFSKESLDGGVTWTTGPERPQEVWSPQMTRVWRPDTAEMSSDGGQTWTTVPNAPGGTQDRVVTDTGVLLAIAWDGTAYRLLPGSPEWEPIGSVATSARPGNLDQPAISDDGESILLTRTAYTPDGGRTWKSVVPDAFSHRVRLAGDGTLTTLEILGDPDSKRPRLVLRRSNDHGETWVEAAAFRPPYDWRGHIQFFSNDGQRILLSGGIMTWDGGAHWTDGSSWFYEAAYPYGRDRTRVELTLLKNNRVLATSGFAFTWYDGKGAKTSQPLVIPGNVLSRFVVAADGQSVAGVLSDRWSPDFAWSSTNGLDWQRKASVPRELTKNEVCMTPDGLHALLVENGQGDSANPSQSEFGGDEGYQVKNLVVVHGSSRRKVASYVNTWPGGSSYRFRGAISDDGQTLGVHIDRAGYGGDDQASFVSTDGGKSWWRSSPVKFLAWSIDGKRGLGVKYSVSVGTDGTQVADPHFVSTADSGVTWSRLDLESSNLFKAIGGHSAVYFKGGFLVDRGELGIAFGRPSP